MNLNVLKLTLVSPTKRVALQVYTCMSVGVYLYAAAGAAAAASD